MPLRVLIAEEQQECCQLFSMFLQRCGYEVTSVHNGVSCIESLNASNPYDVLILSWELPWGEGEAVLDWVQYQGMEDLAVVVLTARMDLNYSTLESALPRVTWVQRPFSLAELLDAVESTERAPRNSWRCLESLIRRSTTPVNGVLFDSDATIKHSLDDRVLRRYTPAQQKQRRIPELERDMQPSGWQPNCFG